MTAPVDPGPGDNPPRAQLRTGRALVAGAAAACLLAAACALAWREDAPVVPREGGVAAGGSAWAFLALLAAAFAAYLCSLLALRRHRGAASLRAVTLLAAAIQLLPLGAPLLLSTDAWTYWSYGWIARNGGNPYTDPPSSFPENPALEHMGAAWRETTSVYGPAFTLASEPVAAAAGSSSDAAAWIFKALAGTAALAAAIAAGRLSRRRALAVAFVGWNPLLAVHLAGGGHNDAWVAALLAAALALAQVRRLDAAGAAWALAIGLKWIPAAFLLLRAAEARYTGRETRHRGFAAAAAAIVVLATWRYGHDWLRAFAPLAANAARQTEYAIPSRLEQLGLPEAAALAIAGAALAAGFVLLVREAHRGHARLGRAALLLLVTTPYLAVWYLSWAVTLAAVDDDDRLARAGVLVLCAYLLPQTVPL